MEQDEEILDETITEETQVDEQVEESEEPLQESMTPDNIADLINEDLKPGHRGLMSEEETGVEGELLTEADMAAQGGMKDGEGNPIDAKTSLETIVNTSGHLLQHAEKAAAACKGGDVQQARFHFSQMLGAAQTGYKTANDLCTMYGLPPLAVQG